MFACDTGRVSARHFVSGYAPDSAVTFFCFAKRKSPKKRRAGFVARRFAPVRCVARFGRGAQKLALRAQTSAPLIRPTLRYSPPHNGGEQPATRALQGFSDVWAVGMLGCLNSPAVEAGLSSAGAGGSGLALSERSEFSQTPPDASSARNREAALTSPRLLFAYFLLAKQEKVSRPPGRDPACHAVT